MALLMKSRTINISINRDSKIVYEFVLNLANLPKWAKTFCRSIQKVNDEWIIETPQGPVKIRITGRNDFGILDHYVSPAQSAEVFVPMRVVSNGSGSEVIFTVFQQSGMSDENYAKDILLVEQDLRTLKSILENRE